MIPGILGICVIDVKQYGQKISYTPSFSATTRICVFKVEELRPGNNTVFISDIFEAI